MESKENHWLHDDDFEKDLYEISEFCTSAPSSPIKQIPKPSVHVQKARAKASIYEETYDNEANIEPPRPKGRGISLLWKDKTFTPGGDFSFLERQKETANEIRMTSGFGYCNDQIEHMLNVNSASPNVSLMDEVKLNATSSMLRNGSQNNGENPPLALYDIIRQKASKSSSDRGNDDKCPNTHSDRGNNDKCPNIYSQKEFPKL